MKIVLALAVMGSGLALGSVLGDAADPTPKRPAQQWWQSGGEREAGYSYEQQESGAWPVYPSVPDKYRPDLDYEAFVATYWEPPRDWGWFDEDTEAVEPVDAYAPESLEEPNEASAAADAADAVVRVADAAQAAQAVPIEAPAIENIAPRSSLSEAGLY